MKALAPERAMPCPELECDGTLRRRWSRKHGRWFYGCDRFPRCRAGVGCHDDGRPLGTPADRETRRARKRAHDAFDALWREGHLTRGEAYAWLANKFGLTEVHIGEMTRGECERVVKLSEAELRRRLRWRG